MVQINAGDFRKGAKVVIEGDPYDMLECNFVKPGKGQALYKCRLRNLLKNTIIDRTYKSGDGLEGADVRKGEGQFLYRERDALVFMDQESYEQAFRSLIARVPDGGLLVCDAHDARVRDVCGGRLPPGSRPPACASRMRRCSSRMLRC